MKHLYFELLPGDLRELIGAYMAYSSPLEKYTYAAVAIGKKQAGKKPERDACVACNKTRNVRLPLRWRRRYADRFDPKGPTPLCFECYYRDHRDQMQTDLRDSRRYIGVAHPYESGGIAYMFEDLPAINLLGTSEAGKCATVAYGKYCVDLVKTP